MQFRKRFYTFIIASHANARVRRVSLPYPVLLAVGFFALVGLITAGAASYRFCRMIIKVQDYDHLVA